MPCQKNKTKLFAGAVNAGFPSPASDYVEDKLDLNEHLIRHPASTFFVRVAGDSMIGAGIFDGDILIVDRSIKPINLNIVIAVLDDEFTVKRLLISKNGAILYPENPKYKPVEIKSDSGLIIWGVVTYVIHKL